MVNLNKKLKSQINEPRKGIFCTSDLKEPLLTLGSKYKEPSV